MEEGVAQNALTKGSSVDNSCRKAHDRYRA
jgi:hypothetical protein